MFDTILDWARGNPWDIFFIIVGTVLLSVINEEKQSRKAYFWTLGGIAFVVLWFAFKYLVGSSGPDAPSSTSTGIPWGKLVGALLTFLPFVFLTILAARPWNVAPPKLKYPVDDKGSKEVREETDEEKAQRKREERYFHWPSIIGYLGMGLSLCTLFFIPWKFWILNLVLFAFFFWLVGNLSVPVRRRWLLKFMGDFIQDRDSGWLRWSHIRTKCIREFTSLQVNDGTRRLHLEKMIRNGFFMDAGWNRIPLLAIILPFVKIEAIQYEEVEVRFQTEQLPTMGQPERKEDRDQNRDKKDDNIIGAAATLSLDQRVKCVVGEFPYTYIYKAGADRAEAVQVTSRFIASYNAQELATMTIGEAMFYPFFEKDGSGSTRPESHIPTADDVKKAHGVILEELDRLSREYNGVGITDYKVLDRNPEDSVQAAMQELTRTKIQEETGLRKGVAAGNQAVAEIERVRAAFMVDGKHTLSFEQVALYLINRARAERAQTHYVDGLSDLAKGAAAFGGGRSGRS